MVQRKYFFITLPINKCDSTEFSFFSFLLCGTHFPYKKSQGKAEWAAFPAAYAKEIKEIRIALICIDKGNTDQLQCRDKIDNKWPWNWAGRIYTVLRHSRLQPPEDQRRCKAKEAFIRSGEITTSSHKISNSNVLSVPLESKPTSDNERTMAWINIKWRLVGSNSTAAY